MANKPTIGHKLIAVFEPGKNLLVISGTLEPPNEAAHEQLAALLDEENHPEITVEFTNVNDVLSVSLTFEHKKRDIAAHGAAELKLRHQARDKGIPLATHKANLKAEAEAATKAEAEAKKKSKGGKKDATADDATGNVN